MGMGREVYPEQSEGSPFIRTTKSPKQLNLLAWGFFILGFSPHLVHNVDK